MQLNEEINKYYNGDNLAFVNILKIMGKDIYAIINKYNIPGMDKDDLRAIAIKEVYDCLQERPLKRGKGIKKVLNINDSELKNRNFIKAAINYGLIRELRSTKANIHISYDIPFLQEDGSNYLDRKGKPLYIGVIYHNGNPYLIEDKKNTKVILNVDKNSINKNDTTFDYKNPIDGGVSLDLMIDDKDNQHEIKDCLEFKISNSFYNKERKNSEIRIMIDIINSKPIKTIYKRTIKMIIKKSNGDIKDLQEYVNKIPKRIEKVKPLLANIFSIGV